MTKDEARKLLENWINEITQDRLGEHNDMRLPMNDEIIANQISFNNSESLESLNQYTFKGLIKIAYNLKDNEIE